MKKTIAVLTFAICLFLCPALSMAEYTGPGASGQVATVADLSNLRDDTMVQMTGKLVRQLGDEKYEFKDETGTVVVEIDREIWQGISVGPDDVVIIYGELDKGFSKTEVDVKRISIK